MNERLAPVFNSQEELQGLISDLSKKAEEGRRNWLSVFKEPIDELNSILEEALRKMETDPASCWKKLEWMKAREAREIKINVPLNGGVRKINVVEVRQNGETASLEIRIKYPRGETAPPYDWEVYTTSFQWVAGKSVLVLDQEGRLQEETAHFPQMPLLSLQASGRPRERLNLVERDPSFNNPVRAREIFEFGIEQVRQALENPQVEVIPQLQEK